MVVHFLVVFAAASASLGSTSLDPMVVRDPTRSDRADPHDPGRRLRTQRVDVHFDGVPLRQAIVTLSAEWNVPMILSAKLGERRELPVSLELRDVAALSVLKLLADEFDLSILQTSAGLIYATTRQDAVDRTAVLRFYDVADKFFAPSSFPGPELGLRPSSHFDRDPPPREIPGQGWDPGALLDVLRLAAGGDAAFEFEGVSMQVFGGTLVVRHTPAVQRKIETALRQL